MLRKYQQVVILLVGLLYVYSVCPLLCAAFEQSFCQNAQGLSGVTETHVCCQSPKTAAAGGAENPSESGKLCCATDLELVLPDDKHNTHEFREAIDQSLVSILPISATLRVAPSEAFQVLRAPLISTFFPDDNSLSRRGPPFAQG